MKKVYNLVYSLGLSNYERPSFILQTKHIYLTQKNAGCCVCIFCLSDYMNISKTNCSPCYHLDCHLIAQNLLYSEYTDRDVRRSFGKFDNYAILSETLNII